MRDASQPWRCLWRGFLQMIRTVPSRRTTLQFSHRTLMDGLTFIAASLELLESIGDAAARQIIGRQLDLHLVAREDADEVHAHLARHVRQYSMPIVQRHAKHRIGQWLHDSPLDLDRVFFSHGVRPSSPYATRVKTSGPSSVMAIVSSK